MSVLGVSRALSGLKQLAVQRRNQRGSLLRPISPGSPHHTMDRGFQSTEILPPEKEELVTHSAEKEAEQQRKHLSGAVNVFVSLHNRRLRKEAFTKHSWFKKSVSSPALHLNVLRSGKDKSQDLSPLFPVPPTGNASDHTPSADDDILNRLSDVPLPKNNKVSDKQGYTFHLGKVQACTKFLQKRKSSGQHRNSSPKELPRIPSPKQTISQRMVIDALQIMQRSKKPKVSFKAVALRVLEFVSMERKLRHCVAPDSSAKGAFVSWGRLKTFFSAAKTWKQSTLEKAHSNPKPPDLPAEAVFYLDPEKRCPAHRRFPYRKGTVSGDVYRSFTGQPYYQRLFQGMAREEEDSASSVWSSDRSANSDDDSEVEYLYRGARGKPFPQSCCCRVATEFG